MLHILFAALLVSAASFTDSVRRDARQLQSSTAERVTSGTATIHKDVAEVSVVFTAEDVHRHAVKDLREEEITVLEDGVPVPALIGFRQDSEMPLRLAVLLDRSDSMQKSFTAERQAMEKSLTYLLRPNIDSFFILDFAGDSSVESAPGSPTFVPARVESLRVAGQTALYDAVYRAVREMNTYSSPQEPVRHAMILFSDGDDTASLHDLWEAIESAERANIAIYAITAHSRRYRYPADTILRRLTQSTGGRFFVLQNFGQADSVFTRIESELRSRYSLSFHPLPERACGYHAIQIRASRRKVRIRTREGYYACSP